MDDYATTLGTLLIVEGRMLCRPAFLLCARLCRTQVTTLEVATNKLSIKLQIPTFVGINRHIS